MIGGWTVGYPGSCLYGANYGYRFGRTTYKMALIEVCQEFTSVSDLIDLQRNIYYLGRQGQSIETDSLTTISVPLE